jgi:uncharacterized protein
LKILIFLLAILFGVWLWRRNRLNALKEKEKSNNASAQASAQVTPNLSQPSPMHACDHCGVHLPESDMLKGRSGRYCSEVHRQAAGDQPP